MAAERSNMRRTNGTAQAFCLIELFCVGATSAFAAKIDTLMVPARDASTPPLPHNFPNVVEDLHYTHTHE